jgi:hypothetical protein
MWHILLVLTICKLCIHAAYVLSVMSIYVEYVVNIYTYT